MRTLRAKEKGLFLAFAGTCLAFGTLGLVLCLRAVVQDEILLLELNNALYPLVLLFPPASTHLVYEILERKYRVLRWVAWVNWAVAALGLVGVLTHRAFTGQWIHYAFGTYPVSAWFLKPWGIIGALSYFIFAPALYWRYLRNNSLHGKRMLALGHNLLIILAATNLPSFIGIPFFPGGTFSFIPMLILAHGVFRSDILDLHTLLFKRNGLFYFLNALIGCVFFAISAAVIRLVVPLDIDAIPSAPWLFVPLISALAVFGLGILVGGTNPGSPLNQLGAFSLFIYGAQLISSVGASIISDPIVSLRVTQLCYVVFCLAPTVQIRFGYLAIGRPLPRYFFLFDLASLTLSLLAFTPWLFTGYFDFPWGRFLASGPVIQALGGVAFIGIVIVVREWWKARKAGQMKSIGNFAVAFLVMGAIMLLLNLPATSGIPIYPLGNLSIIPTAILAYGVLKHGSDVTEKHALKVSHRVSLLSLMMIPIVLFLMLPVLPNHAPAYARVLHVILFGAPILLLGYQLAFFLTRPISASLDATFENLASARRTAEILKQETETLSELAKKVNSTSNLDAILKFVLDFLRARFGDDAYLALYLANEERRELALHLVSGLALDPDAERRLYALKIPFGNEGGTLARTYARQKPFHLARINEAWLPASRIDAEIKDIFGLNSFVHVPLVIQGRTLGILAMTWPRNSPVAHRDLKLISSMGDQIAGAVQNAVLLKQTEDAKKSVEATAQELTDLNAFARLLNSTLDIHDVFSAAFDFIVKRTNIDMVCLMLLDKKENTFKAYPKALIPLEMPEKSVQFFREWDVPLETERGTLYHTFTRKKPFYVNQMRMGSTTINDIDGAEYEFSRLDLKIAIHGRLKSLLQIPLVLNDEVIGILNLSAYGEKMNLTPSDISRIVRICDQITGAFHNALLHDQILSLLAETETAREKADALLLNILPADIAHELKEKGEVRPVLYESATILFTDFKGFTRIAELLPPAELIRELDGCFSQFDEIVHRFNLEKLKTIGDSYMCIGGLPARNRTHAIDACLAALEFQAFMNQMEAIKNQLGLPFWQMRLGIHSGPVIAGVVGRKKFAFDVWGDAVNTASRLETAGEVGKINISQDTFELVKDFFKTEYRGTVPVKNKGEDVGMHFLLGLKDSMAADERVPNREFHRRYAELRD